MKKISKTKHDQLKTIKYVNSEKQVLSQSRNPFILSLKTCFQTDKCFYMITQFAACGDLSLLLARYKRLGEDVTKMLCAEILIAMEYLHDLDVIYGDLKPENILLDKSGHILLADYGLSWCGSEPENLQTTDEFMSPEQLLGGVVGKTIDFWGLV